VNRKILLLVEEEYPNPCEPVIYSGKLLIPMDLGEVVENNLTDFDSTTPSPHNDLTIKQN